MRLALITDPVHRVRTPGTAALKAPDDLFIAYIGRGEETWLAKLFALPASRRIMEQRDGSWGHQSMLATRSRALPEIVTTFELPTSSTGTQRGVSPPAPANQWLSQFNHKQQL